MWSSRLFLKLFAVYAGLIVLAVAACSAIVAGWQEDQLVEQVRRRLRDSAILLRDDLQQRLLSDSRDSLQRKIQDLGQQTDTRFTVLDAEGTVLADSEQPSLAEVAKMSNHLGRPEFIQAGHSGDGFSRRLSPTMRVPYFYYAVSIESDQQTIGYVRAAQPSTAIAAQASELRRLILLAGIGVGLAGLAATFLLTRRIVQPIRDLTTAVEQMTVGESPGRVGINSSDEVGTLARAFERMFERLGKRESALRESADRQSTVLSGMNEGVLAVDNNQRVLFANVAAGDMLGFKPDQAKERSLLELVRSNDLHEIAQRAQTTELLAESEIEWQAETLRTLDVNAAPLPGDPCPGVVLVMHDITELKRLEGLRQQFVANVSHELKTPLSSIKAYTETLLNGALDDTEHAQHFLSRIDDQADRLHELIIDLLALARIESGQATIERTAISLPRIIDACLTDYEARAEAAEIALLAKVADNAKDVFADEESLRQILNNLIDNALKYTPDGGTITVLSREEADQAVIEVSDTGPGIDHAHHERLFERFYRVDKARSRELGGTGLGLAIVKHLCNAMDGTVSIESTPGEGSTFRVRLPLAAT